MNSGDLKRVNTRTDEKSEEVFTQTGVKRAEAVAIIWTKQSLYVAYAGFVIVLVSSYMLQYAICNMQYLS